MSSPTEIVNQYVEAYNNRNLDTLCDLFRDPFQFNGEELAVDEFSALVEAYWEAFPDLILEHTHQLADGEYVFDRHVFETTGTDEYYGHDVSDKTVECAEMMLFRVQDGAIGEYWYEWDELGFWRQLEVVENPYEGA